MSWAGSCRGKALASLTGGREVIASRISPRQAESQIHSKHNRTRRMKISNGNEALVPIVTTLGSDKEGKPARERLGERWRHLGSEEGEGDKSIRF